MSDHDFLLDLCARTEGQFQQDGRLPLDPRCRDPYLQYDYESYDESYDEAGWQQRGDAPFDGMEEASDSMYLMATPEEPAVDPATTAPQTPQEIPMPGSTDTDDGPPEDTDTESDADAPEAPPTPPWKRAPPASKRATTFPTVPPMAKVKAATPPWRTAATPPAPPPPAPGTKLTTKWPAAPPAQQPHAIGAAPDKYKLSKWSPAQTANSSLVAVPKQKHAIGAAPAIAGLPYKSPSIIAMLPGTKLPMNLAPPTPPPHGHPKAKAKLAKTQTKPLSKASFFEDECAQSNRISQAASSSSGDSSLVGQLLLEAAEKDPAMKNALLKQYYEAEAKAAQIGNALNVSWRDAGPRPEYGPMPEKWKGRIWRPNAQRWGGPRGGEHLQEL